MSQNAQRDSAVSPLAAARTIHNVLGDLAKLAQQAQLEGTEVMILAARIEALGVIRRLRAAQPDVPLLTSRNPAAGGGNGKAG